MFKKLSIFIVLAGMFLLAVNVSTVVAAPPAPLHIEVLEWPGDNSPVPFTATGPAVDIGLVCATGMVVELDITSNLPSGPFQILRVLKRFTCDDLSGTFDIKMVVKLDFATNDTAARWQIVGGTGDYANLIGQGSLIGESNLPGEFSILDRYDGKVQ